MTSFFARLLDTADFPARWQCGQWDAGHGWLHILSDLGVWAAYVAIPVALVVFARRRKDVPFRNLFWLFSGFILFCGATHLMEAVIFWWPAYRLAGVIKLATAVISWATVLALLPVIPRTFAMRFPEELEREAGERRRAEAELRASEERFRAVVESAVDAIVTIDRAGRVVGWNGGAERAFGYAAAEAIGRDVALVIPDRHRAGHAGRLAGYAPDRPPAVLGRVMAADCVRRDGTEFPAELTVTPWTAGGQTHFTAIVRDVTDRKRAAEGVARSERYYRTLFEHAHDPILVFDPDGERVLDANPEACRVYGFARDEFVGRSLADLSADPGRGRGHVAAVTDGRGCHRFETVQFRRDGRPLELKVNASVVEFDGRTAVLSINRDVTGRRRAERRLAARHATARALAEGAISPQRPRSCCGRRARPATGPSGSTGPWPSGADSNASRTGTPSRPPSSPPADGTSPSRPGRGFRGGCGRPGGGCGSRTWRPTGTSRVPLWPPAAGCGPGWPSQCPSAVPWSGCSPSLPINPRSRPTTTGTCSSGWPASSGSSPSGRGPRPRPGSRPPGSRPRSTGPGWVPPWSPRTAGSCARTRRCAGCSGTPRASCGRPRSGPSPTPTT